MLTAICGGVGAARLLRGVLDVVDPATVTGIVNVGDDTVLHGLSISPDLDTITYTHVGVGRRRAGLGTERRDVAGHGGPGTFQRRASGGVDRRRHLVRAGRHRPRHPPLPHRPPGRGRSPVDRDGRGGPGLRARPAPAAGDRRPAETRIVLAEDGSELGFQEWFVGRQHAPAVSSVRFVGAAAATPGPGVLDAIAGATCVVVCPSNPVVSIDPVLAVPGVRAALEARREDTVAVSPIVAGAALKGPAADLLRDLGHDVSVVGVARLYAPFCSTLVVDEADADLAGAVEAAGLRCVVAPTVMSGPAEAAALARVVLSC